MEEGLIQGMGTIYRRTTIFLYPRYIYRRGPRRDRDRKVFLCKLFSYLITIPDLQTRGGGIKYIILGLGITLLQSFTSETLH